MAKRAKEEPKNDNVVYTYFQNSLAWVKANRRTAITAAAAIVLSFCAAGAMPPMNRVGVKGHSTPSPKP